MDARTDSLRNEEDKIEGQFNKNQRQLSKIEAEEDEDQGYSADTILTLSSQRIMKWKSIHSCSLNSRVEIFNYIQAASITTTNNCNLTMTNYFLYSQLNKGMNY